MIQQNKIGKLIIHTLTTNHIHDYTKLIESEYKLSNSNINRVCYIGRGVGEEEAHTYRMQCKCFVCGSLRIL